jgi:hypothetical protein
MSSLGGRSESRADASTLDSSILKALGRTDTTSRSTAYSETDALIVGSSSRSEKLAKQPKLGFSNTTWSDPMGRSAGVRPNCSLNVGKNSTGKQLDGQAKSLTQRLVSESWACHSCHIRWCHPECRRRPRMKRRRRLFENKEVKAACSAS